MKPLYIHEIAKQNKKNSFAYTKEKARRDFFWIKKK
jgi:hypothetical protein